MKTLKNHWFSLLVGALAALGSVLEASWSVLLGGFQKAGLERFPVVLVGAIGHRKKEGKPKKQKPKNIENPKKTKKHLNMFLRQGLRQNT